MASTRIRIPSEDSIPIIPQDFDRALQFSGQGSQLRDRIQALVNWATQPVIVWRQVTDANNDIRLQSTLVPLSGEQLAQVNTWLRALTNWLRDPENNPPPPDYKLTVHGVERNLVIPPDVRKKGAKGDRIPIFDWLKVKFSDLQLSQPVDIFLEETDEQGRSFAQPVVFRVSLSDTTDERIWNDILLAVARQFLTAQCGCATVNGLAPLRTDQLRYLKFNISPFRNLERFVFYARPLTDVNRIPASQKTEIEDFLVREATNVIASSRAVCYELTGGQDNRRDCSAYFVTALLEAPEDRRRKSITTKSPTRSRASSSSPRRSRTTRSSASRKSGSRKSPPRGRSKKASRR